MRYSSIRVEIKFTTTTTTTQVSKLYRVGWGKGELHLKYS